MTGSAQAVVGRPREVRLDGAILAATLELVAEVGIHDFRMDDVAGRAGVGKAAIYRRYRSKDELVTATVAALVSEITVPDTGSTREDLLARCATRSRCSATRSRPASCPASWGRCPSVPSWLAPSATVSSPSAARRCARC